MFGIRVTSRFERDLKSCKKRHWNMTSFEQALNDLLRSDEAPLAPQYKDHALEGALKGFRSLHVVSAPNPPKDKWVLLYEIQGDTVHLLRTGAHEEVYGKAV